MIRNSKNLSKRFVCDGNENEAAEEEVEFDEGDEGDEDEDDDDVDVDEDGENESDCPRGSSQKQQANGKSVKRGVLPKFATSTMRKWLFQHIGVS